MSLKYLMAMTIIRTTWGGRNRQGKLFRMNISRGAAGVVTLIILPARRWWSVNMVETMDSLVCKMMTGYCPLLLGLVPGRQKSFILTWMAMDTCLQLITRVWSQMIPSTVTQICQLKLIQLIQTDECNHQVEILCIIYRGLRPFFSCLLRHELEFGER